MFNYPRILSDFTNENKLKTYFRRAVMHGICIQQNKFDNVDRSLYHSYRLGIWIGILWYFLARNSRMPHANIYDMVVGEAQRFLRN